MLTQLKQKAQAIRVVGGKGAVSDSMYLGFAKHFNTARLSGASRYETNVAVNGYVTSVCGTSPTTIWVATGKNFLGSRELELPVNGDSVALGVELPNGTVVTLSEPTAPKVDGYTWKGVAFSQEKIVIGEQDAPVLTATNTYESDDNLAKTGAAGIGLGLGLGVALLGLGAMAVRRSRKA